MYGPVASNSSHHAKIPPHSIENGAPAAEERGLVYSGASSSSSSGKSRAISSFVVSSGPTY